MPITEADIDNLTAGEVDKLYQKVCPLGSSSASELAQKPTERQRMFLDLDSEREVFYGGAAGGGKSSCLLMAALKYVNVPGYSALLLRRTYADLSKPGALMDRAHQWLKGTSAKWNEQKKQWTFPGGAMLTFGYLEAENDKYQYQGAEYQCVAEGTLLRMADGTEKPIESVNVGDVVQTLQGGRKVTHTFPRRLAECVQVRGGKGQQVHPRSHRILTLKGWLSYDDIAFASRLSAFFLSMQCRDVRKFASPSLQPIRLSSQLPLVRCSDCQHIVGQFELLAGHLSSSDSAVYTEQLNQGNGFVEFVCGLQDAAPRLSVYKFAGHLQRIFSSDVFDSLLPAFYCEDRNAHPASLLADFLRNYSRDFHLCDARLHLLQEGVEVLPLQLGGVVVQIPNSCSAGAPDETRRYTHPELLYDHPYRTGDKCQSSESVSLISLAASPCGERYVYDLTVDDANHYITTFGLVNQNCIGFDELTQFTESQYTYLFSRLRRLTNSDVPLRMRAASNPGGMGARWVQDRFVPENFEPHMAEEPIVFWKEGINADGNTVRRAFIPARLDDNPYLDREEYAQSLNELDAVTREQLLKGDWQIRERGNVYPMWEDGINGKNVITWSQFEKVVGVRYIPKHWLGAMGHDPGFDPDPRAAVWNFVAGANSPLAGDVFCIRELYANRMTVDDFADEVKRHEAPLSEAARIRTRVIGHEASSEQATLAQKHKLNFVKTKPDANGGIAQMRHALRVTDLDKPHPFKPHLVGRPHFYVVVDDREMVNPKTEKGMVNFRAEMAAYRYIDGSPTAQKGSPKIVPYDFFNHLMDAQRNIAAVWFARTASLTDAERIESKVHPNLKADVIEQAVQAGTRDRQGAMMARIAEIERIRLDEQSQQYTHPLAEPLDW